MWIRVAGRRAARLIFGSLDNEPLDGELELGQELAVSYDKVREHRKPWEFKKN
jgi:hypothetical protein